MYYVLEIVLTEVFTLRNAFPVKLL